MSLQIVGLLGYAKSGKSTLASLIVEHGDDKKDVVMHRYSLACPLKKGVQAMFGLTDEQLYTDAKMQVDPRYGVTPREILQFVGTDLIRKQLKYQLPRGGTLWVSRFHDLALELQRMADADSKRHILVIDDVRFPDEADALLCYPDTKFYHVKRQSTEPPKSDLAYKLNIAFWVARVLSALVMVYVLFVSDISDVLMGVTLVIAATGVIGDILFPSKTPHASEDVEGLLRHIRLTRKTEVTEITNESTKRSMLHQYVRSKARYDCDPDAAFGGVFSGVDAVAAGGDLPGPADD